MYKSKFLKKSYRLIKSICAILSKEFKFFRLAHKALNEFEKTIRLFFFTQEFLSKKGFKFTVVDDIKYPTVDTIKKLHDFLVIKYQKDTDKIHRGEYSLAELDFTGIKYWMDHKRDHEEDLVFRGACIFNKFLEEGHPFVDGNKRTGWATLWVFLAANGLIFFFPNSYQSSKQAKTVEKWAILKEDSENIKEIMEWIKKYIKK